MKHLPKILSALLLTTTFLVQSCKKTEQPAIPAPDVAAILQSKNWQLKAATVSPAQGGVTDIYNTWLGDCNKDDLFIFKANNAFVLDEGATKCLPTDDQSSDGTWNYNSSTKILFWQLTPPADAYNFLITQIDGNSFTGVEHETISGVDYTYTWVFAKQ